MFFTYIFYTVTLCCVKDLDSTDSTQVDDDIDVTAADDDDDDDGNEMCYESEASVDAADDYMPVRRIVSDKEQLKQDELQQNIYSPTPVVQVKTVPSSLANIPVHLTAYAFDIGDVSSFPSPKKDDSNKLGWISVS